jgi:hypothetical protein
VTVFDDAARAAANVAPTPNRAACIGTLVGSTMAPKGVGVTSFTLLIDLGSGPVPASATATLLNQVYALSDPSVVYGTQVIVIFIQGSPVVLDFLGNIAIHVL